MMKKLALLVFCVFFLSCSQQEQNARPTKTIEIENGQNITINAYDQELVAPIGIFSNDIIDYNFACDSQPARVDARRDTYITFKKDNIPYCLSKKFSKEYIILDFTIVTKYFSELFKESQKGFFSSLLDAFANSKSSKNNGIQNEALGIGSLNITTNLDDEKSFEFSPKEQIATIHQPFINGVKSLKISISKLYFDKRSKKPSSEYAFETIVMIKALEKLYAQRAIAHYTLLNRNNKHKNEDLLQSIKDEDNGFFNVLAVLYQENPKAYYILENSIIKNKQTKSSPASDDIITLPTSNEQVKFKTNSKQNNKVLDFAK